MSTYWGYVCQSHEPELVSERWWNRGAADLAELYERVRRGDWPIVTPDIPHIGLVYQGEPYNVDRLPGGGIEPVLPGGQSDRGWSGPVSWLAEHPRCKVALRSEYDAYRALVEKP